VFASALDWPGWCRRGQGDEAAIGVLLDYAGRYTRVAGPGFAPGEVQVIGRVASDMSADFGAPGVSGPWDDEPLKLFGPGRARGRSAAYPGPGGLTGPGGRCTGPCGSLQCRSLSRGPGPAIVSISCGAWSTCSVVCTIW
jgi:hypothetical protein